MVQILIFQNLFRKKRMCYLKSIKTCQVVKSFDKNEQVKAQFTGQNCKFLPFQTYFFYPENIIIPQFNIFYHNLQIKNQISQASESIRLNALRIQTLNKKLQECDQKVAKLCSNLKQLEHHDQLEKIAEKRTRSSFQDLEIEQLANNSFQSQKFLTLSLFGNKRYQYKLILTEAFPDTIYRERNIKIRVKLISLKGQVLKNDNVINLYLSLCDNKGKWVINNRVGDPMLKGKTSTQLCSGESQFNKIYPQDISRTFFQGQINIVIYAKSLAMVYDQKITKTLQKRFINPQLIEPLIIQKVAIKAKKRAEQNR